MDDNALPHEDRPELANARRSRNFLILAIALLLLKLLLVSQREMVPETDDAESYVRHSLEDLPSIFGGYSGHPPGASLVMALARLLGIPYRIFLEVFLAAAAFWFFRPLIASMRLGIAAAAFSYGALDLPSHVNSGVGPSSVRFRQLLVVAGGRRRHHWICGRIPGEASVVEFSGWRSRASHSSGSHVPGKGQSSSSKWLRSDRCPFFSFAERTPGGAAAQL